MGCDHLDAAKRAYQRALATQNRWELAVRRAFSEGMYVGLYTGHPAGILPSDEEVERITEKNWRDYDIGEDFFDPQPEENE